MAFETLVDEHTGQYWALMEIGPFSTEAEATDAVTKSAGIMEQAQRDYWAETQH